MKGPCLFCGARGAVDAHHATGRRGAGQPYLDPWLVIPLCRRCHVMVHVGLRRAGLGSPMGDTLSHRLARVAELGNRCADGGRGLALDVCSTRGLAMLLLDGAAVLAGRSAEVPG